jgi:hypothetical protein
MALTRPQFRLSTLLWITLAVACWFGGMLWNGRQVRKERESWEIELANLKANCASLQADLDEIGRLSQRRRRRNFFPPDIWDKATE